MKKILLLIGVLLVLIGGGFVAYNTFRHKPVHGTILLDYDKKKIDKHLSHLDQETKKIDTEGKWLEDEQVLILPKENAQKLLKLQVLNKVTVNKDKYSFKPVTQLPEGSILFSKEPKFTIKNDFGEKVVPKQTEYTVLGESSMFVKHILVTDDYQTFQNAHSIYLAAFKSKEDATKTLTNYKDIKINQLYNPTMN
ncbi:lipoprotein BA_5634 family protein [Enterococcus raffinosus]|uniref:lipoprotein BA_5634 family protein n=1 Tax=Enterococcus raffinosus TaxID=71452 RepID=UPI0028905B4A|nr:lipoprotein BA_5634 family protein [Enterococcus raffinosus]MDT2522017.1 lipoprotein BA_5634 family protein [Enterococcus raffinosus]MDT2589517.1 lipoprotein BA_5634 family protein [Enterococcus raffinosus]